MDFGRISGWIGIILLAISFCTAIRSPRLSSKIGGYRFQIRMHHWLGIAAIASMIAHLGILLFDYSASLDPLFDPYDGAIMVGWIALICSVAVAAVAFRFRSTPYRRWRRIHLLLTLGFLAGILHTYLILEPRAISEWSLIGIVALIGIYGIASALWIPMSASFGVPYEIVRQCELRPDLYLQMLKPIMIAGAIRVQAGQFVFLRYSAPQFSGMWHPFTPIGFSDSGELELLVKSRGRDTNLLHDIQLPSPIRINGPFSVNFWHSSEPQLWIAYGIGIAIFLVAARSLPRGMENKVHLIYCEKNPERIVFGTEFDALRTRRTNFSWEQYYGEGREVLIELAKKIQMWPTMYKLFRICGHPGFQKTVKDLLIANGVRKNSILLEGVF